jgi:hypothetical protein
MERPLASTAAVGFTVKSGWACVVLLTGAASAPHVADSRRIELSDPAIPESRQPYHAGFTIARSEGPELTRLVGSVERFGRQSVDAVIRQYRNAGHDLRGAGVVVGSLIDPGTIANEHIRIHAREGQLFRRVVEEAAARNGLSCSICRERDLQALAAGALGQTDDALRRAATLLGGGHKGSWRAEHKAAALAAWMVLAGGALTLAWQNTARPGQARRSKRTR